MIFALATGNTYSKNATRAVDASHVLFELGSVIIAIEVVARDKQVGVNHLMLQMNAGYDLHEKRVNGVRTLSKRKERLRQPNRNVHALHAADACAERHPLTPLDRDELQCVVEVLLIEQLRLRELHIKIRQIEPEYWA